MLKPLILLLSLFFCQVAWADQWKSIPKNSEGFSGFYETSSGPQYTVPCCSDDPKSIYWWGANMTDEAIKKNLARRKENSK